MADRPVAKSKRKPGRRRRVAGWFLLVIGVLITGVCEASRWWCVGRTTSSLEIFVGGGLLRLNYLGTVPTVSASWYCVENVTNSGWNLFTSDMRIGSLRPTARHNLRIFSYAKYEYAAGVSVLFAAIVLWPFALVSLFGGGWLVWSGRRACRRAMSGVCLKCGYDLRGLAAESLCPECGSGGAAVAAR